jgi:CAAX protease family protein
MGAVRSLLIYLGAVFLGGALLAPWLYWSVQSLAEHFPAFERLAANPFHRFVNRSLLGLALLGVWPLMRSLGVKSPRDVGLISPWGQWRRLAGGFALGFISLACVAVVSLFAGTRGMNDDASATRLLERIAGAAVTAVAVSLLEELLFRGAIFGALRKAVRWPTAALISGAIYAIVHYFARPEPPMEITWQSGFATLLRMLHGFVDLEQVVPGFFTLVMAGALLAVAYERTGNLYFAIGLHAGWIFWRSPYALLTRPADGANAWFWGSDKLTDGWLGLAILVALLPVLLRLTARPEQPAPEPCSLASQNQ